MFDVGFFELVIIFVIGLLVLGPERLPRVAAKIGNWVGQARRMTRNLKYQLEDELALQEREARAKKFVAEIEQDIRGTPKAQAAPASPSQPAAGSAEPPPAPSTDPSERTPG